jgi:riboflavin biosynthesis pyrimidine reductase
MILGGKTAKTSVGGLGFDSPNVAKRFKLYNVETIGTDLFLEYKVN